MALTQMQIIQSLGDAMAWFERELHWGVPPTELRHLIGRIGELYAALITNGQMATDVNQHGYDVVSSLGERVSVKTTAVMSNTGIVSFNVNTLDQVDRIIVLRVNTEEMQIETLLDESKDKALEILGEPKPTGRLSVNLSKLVRPPKDRSEIPVVRTAQLENITIQELASGSIEVLDGDELVIPAKPTLRKIAAKLGVSVTNSNGNSINTRQLGSTLIREIQAKF
ncbi:MAG: hypothetical protein RIC55_29780 [Pirellulaceae bacterium]